MDGSRRRAQSAWSPCHFLVTRRSMPDLQQRGGCRLLFEAQGDAVAQLAAGIEPGVEQMPRHDVRQRLEHRLLHAGVLDLEIHDQPLDTLALEAEVAA